MSAENNEQTKENFDTAGNWVGVGTAIGAAMFAVTKEPVWVGVGVAIGAALGWRKPKKNRMPLISGTPKRQVG